MSNEAAERHRSVAATFGARVAGVPPGHWDDAAPVEGWVARDVVRHLLTWFPAFLHSGAGVRLPTGPRLEDDPVEAWRVHSDAVQELLDDPATAERTFDNPHTGALPLPDAIDRFYTSDVFLHTWDLARATGQDERLDPSMCRVLYEGMLPLDELLRASGHYGPRTPVAEDADDQTKLLAFIGRRP